MEPKMPGYVISVATKDEWHHFQDIQDRLGWDPFKKSYLTLGEISPEGMLLGKLKGDVISCILALKYSDKFGFVAVYWVHHKYRGKGYGLEIFKRGMQYLKDVQVLALDSVMDQIPNYAKWGFKVECNSTKRYAYRNVKLDEERTSLVVNQRNKIDINAVALFDANCFPAIRPGFIAKCFEIAHPFVSYDAKSKQVVGYAVVYKCSSGYAIGPLIAISSMVAQDIIKQIFKVYAQGGKFRKAGQSLIVFTLDEKQHIKNLMEKWFPDVMYNCKRMYLRRTDQDFDRSCIYAFSGYQRG